MYEIEDLNPSVSSATVYKHIQKLIGAGIVREVPLDDDAPKGAGQLRGAQSARRASEKSGWPIQDGTTVLLHQ